MVKVQDEGDVNSWPECLHGDWKFLMHSSGIIHHKGNADPEKWAKILEKACQNELPTEHRVVRCYWLFDIRCFTAISTVCPT